MPMTMPGAASRQLRVSEGELMPSLDGWFGSTSASAIRPLATASLRNVSACRAMASFSGVPLRVPLTRAS
jgi:hypothetical protein